MVNEKPAPYTVRVTFDAIGQPDPVEALYSGAVHHRSAERRRSGP